MGSFSCNWVHPRTPSAQYAKLAVLSHKFKERASMGETTAIGVNLAKMYSDCTALHRTGRWCSARSCRGRSSPGSWWTSRRAL